MLTLISCYLDIPIIFNQDIDGIRFINPGSLSSVRGGEGTYILMTIDGENFSIEKCSF